MNKTKFIILIPFLFLMTSLSFAQDCNITSKANDILPDKLCAPVSLTWEVTYRGVNDGGASVEIQADWDDGNPVEVVAATNTDASKKEWQVTFSHTYPQGGDKCNYKPKAMLIVDGVVCTSSIQEQNVTVWDTDDKNGGVLEISPQVFNICVGNEDGTSFTDVSIWNCTPNGGENDNINGKTRWTQWIYGSHHTITGVEVDGTVRSYPDTAAVVEATEYVDAPQAPNNVSLFCNAPATAQVGEYFEVTLRNWNYCNPYDDPNIAGPPADTINGDFPPIEITAMILIVDTPKPNINPAGSFCTNDPDYTLSASPSGGTWSGNGVNSSGVFKPWKAGAGTHIITYTVTDGTYGCSGRDTIQITVFQAPQPDILPGPTAEVCPDDVLFLDGNPTAGNGTITSHLWTGDNAYLSDTTIQKPSFTTSNQGVYNLTYTVSDDNGCSAKDYISISVNPVSAHIIPDPAEVCAGEDLILNGNPSGGTGNYTTHVWTGDVSNLDTTALQSVVFNSTTVGTYNFNYTVTDDNGCQGKDTIVVSVFENPIADAGTNDSICGLSISLNANPSVGTGTWTQVSGAGSISFDDIHNPNATASADQYGVYKISWKEVNGPNCNAIDTIEIRFTEQPNANAGSDGAICGYTYQLNASPSVGAAYWYVLSGANHISFDDSTLFNASITSDVYAEYDLIWVEDNHYGCVDRDTVHIIFEAIPVVAFNPVNPDACTPFSIQFDNQSTANCTYYWDFGNGDTSMQKNPFESFINSGSTDITYPVRLIVNNTACGDTLTQTVTVHPSPIASFSHNASPQCSPVLVDFTAQSNNAVLNIWDFDDGSALDTADNITHTFINDTSFVRTFVVKMIAVSSNGCTDTAKNYITVYPNSHYTIDATPDSACQPVNVSFSTQATGKTYHWDFGNGNALTGSFVTNNYYVNHSDTNQTFNVQLIVQSFFGCLDTSYTQILVHPTPVINFDISNTADCSPLSTDLLNHSTGASKYIWTYGDGTQDTTLLDSIHKVYYNHSTHTVAYNIELKGINDYGCENTLLKSILVYPEVKAQYISDSIGCSPLNIDFTNQSTGASSYTWYFGSDQISTEDQPSHTFLNNSSKNDTVSVKLIALSDHACRDTFTKNIIVYATPDAEFTPTPTQQTYPNTTFNFLNKTSSGDWQYSWSFDDDSSSTLSSTSHSYATWGTYTVWLKAWSPYCIDSISHTVKIIAPQAHPDFTYLIKEGCAPLSVKFYNRSTNATSYIWDFGDGAVSSEENPTHTYYTAGVYIVTLKAANSNNSNEKTLGPLRIYESPIAHFEVTPKLVFIPNQAIKCFNLSTGEDSVYWSFGDGNHSTESNPLHYYKKEGFYDISLIAVNDHNCSDTACIERAVEAQASGKIDFPNAFKPSASGSNGGRYSIPDIENIIFHPVYKGLVEYELNIFNRWGELIFVSKDVNIGWDGYYRDKLCKQDVYVWKAKGKFIDGSVFNLAGDLTLLR